jgi:group I intron endonuclease
MKGIYLIKFNNGDTYVGRSNNIIVRIRKHRYQLKKNIHSNSYMQNVYNKHGDFKYELLEEVTNSSLGIREIFWINELSPTLNLTQGGDGGELLTESEKERRRQLVYNQEYRKKMSEIMKLSSQIKAKERGKKISDSRKKLYEDPERKKWLIENSGIFRNNGYLNQKKRGESPNAKRVINTETGEIFDCLKDVAEKYNRNYSSLISILNEYKRPNKGPFRYLD